MPTESGQIVEGYKAPTPSDAPGAESWLNDLRRDLRREAIKELARARLGLKQQETEARQATRVDRIIEGVIVSVTVSIAAALILAKVHGTQRDT